MVAWEIKNRIAQQMMKRKKSAQVPAAVAVKICK
jgi:hypothetical protein